MKKFQKEANETSREEKRKKQQVAHEERLKRLCIAEHINDDAWMVAEGLRPPMVQPRDPSVWTKTAEERELVRKLKHQKYRLTRGGGGGRKYIPVYLKLIVQVKGWEKTTYSLKCWQNDIPRIIGHFNAGNGQEVIKYQWNGKTYKPNEVPFWP